MQVLKGRNARSDLPMSNAPRKQIGIQPEIIRTSDKHATLPTHDLNVGQHVMFQDSTSKCWYPAVIESLCPEPRSYKILTRDGICFVVMFLCLFMWVYYHVILSYISPDTIH